MAFRVAVPSWGVGTGGTRFARFPVPGEPRNVFEKLDDCEVVFSSARPRPAISLHIPWDKPRQRRRAARIRAERAGLVHRLDELQHLPGSGRRSRCRTSSAASATPIPPCAGRRSSTTSNAWSWPRSSAPARTRCGSATAATSPASCTSAARSIATSTACAAIYAALPDGLPAVHRAQALRARLLLDRAERLGHQLLLRARARRPRACSLVDLGHHAPNVNIEMIVARLIQFGKLGGLPFQRQQVRRRRPRRRIDQAVSAVPDLQRAGRCRARGVPGFDPAYMLDQSHNVTDPIESLMTSAMEVVRAYVQAHLVDRAGARRGPGRNDASRRCSC